MVRLSLGLAVFFLLVSSVLAQNSRRVINDADRVTMHGNTHPLARAEFDRGLADTSLPMQNMILSLNVRPGAQADLQKLLAGQQDSNSPDYRKWLTPEQFGLRFGPTDQDIADVTNWLAARGFTIEEVGKGRLWINFSGNVQQVERAFQTNIRKYEVHGKMYQANSGDPTFPRGFSGLVGGVVTLHNFPRVHFLSRVKQLPPGFFSTRSQMPSDFKVPDFTSGANHFLAPADFATIYNVNPLYSAGITGAGQSIAIVGRTDIKLADVQFFRSFFGLPAKDPVFIHNGAAPGDVGGGEETEADLDVEWSGAVGQGATVNFVISKSTATTDGVDLSAQFIVNNNTSPIMSTSFGLCEANMGTAENNFYNNLWSQAATEGISAFVSTGDSGAAGCDAPNATTGTGRAVSGLSTPPNVTAVGGTEFNEGTGTFWNATNNASNQGSAISYIPEVVWNESGSVAGGSGLGATGGGASSIYAKPTFQSGPGIPADGHRDVPDVSLSAAGHDGYIIVQGHTTGTTGLAAVGGTSASSPSFAGLMSLVVQKTGARQGNANPAFYNMGRNQQAGGTAVYHDITTGNNTVPGTTGFNATVGYDLSTGWGSVNAANLVNFWNNNVPADYSLSAAPASVSVAQSSSATSTISVTQINGFTGSVTLSASGLPLGVTASFGTNPTTSTSVLTLTASSTATTGAATVTVTGTSGTLTHTTTISLTVNVNGVPAVSLTPSSLTFPDTMLGNASTSQSVTLANTGSAPLLINTPNGISISSDFVQTNNCPPSLPANTTCTLTVTFTPTFTGAHPNSNLTITDNAAGSPHQVALSGNGVIPVPVFSPTALTFSDQLVGTPSPSQSVTLKNIGTAPLIISGKSISADFAQTNDCPPSLAVNTTCTFTVTFTPTFAGAHPNSNLAITDNAPGSPHQVALSGNGVTPVLMLSPAALSFPDQNINTPSAPTPVTLTNSGNAPLLISGLSITGDSSNFGLTSNCPASPASLAANTSCTVTVVFTPTAVRQFSGTLSINDNAPGNPHLVPLSGKGVTPVPVFSPSSLVFLPQIVGTSSAPQLITLTNAGTTPISGITSVSGFPQTNNCGTSLPVSASCTITVSFAPVVGGLNLGSISVTGSTTVASLTGSGIPTLTVLSPATVTAGSSNFTLRLTGSGFTSTALVRINGTTRLSFPIDLHSLNVAITSSDVANVGALNVSVVIPGPGGQESGTLPLTVTTNPIPLIGNISPARVIVGYQMPLKLIVNGSFFTSNSKVRINGAERPTTFISPNQLTAVLPASDFIASGLPAITVVDPAATVPANTATLAVFRYGDLTFNDTVNVQDLLSLANFLAGNNTPADPAPGDLNLDGKTNVTDLSVLANFLAGNIQLPAIPQHAVLFNAGATVSLSPPMFAGQTVGTVSDPLPVKLTNGESTPLSISISTAGDYSQTNDCGISLPASQSCTISVTFTPTTAGSSSGTLTVQDGALGPQTANLSGTGIGSAAATTAATTAALSSSLGITDGPVTLTFPSQTVGTNSALQVLRLINTGPTALSISGINIAPSGEFAESSNCGISLAAGTSCNINVTFSPAASGTRTATLTVTDNASNSPQTANLTGTGAP